MKCKNNKVLEHSPENAYTEENMGNDFSPCRSRFYDFCKAKVIMMKISSVLKPMLLGLTVLTVSACGNDSSSTGAAASTPVPAARSSSSGAYVPNPTGKPMSEDIKDELESLHKKEAASIPTIKELPAGSNKGRKVLIAYFTWGGRSGEMARYIQQKTGGDIYEIKRDPDYPSGYNDVIRESARELDEGVMPKVAGTPPDASSYDVLILGYPCWWFTEPLIVTSFLQGQNLKDKLIVPYMCSFSSPFEVTLPALHAAAPDARIFTGLTLDKDTDEHPAIDDWLTKAGF